MCSETQMKHTSETNQNILLQHMRTSPIYFCNIHMIQLQHTSAASETIERYNCNIRGGEKRLMRDAMAARSEGAGSCRCGGRSRMVGRRMLWWERLTTTMQWAERTPWRPLDLREGTVTGSMEERRLARTTMESGGLAAME